MKNSVLTVILLLKPSIASPFSNRTNLHKICLWRTYCSFWLLLLCSTAGERHKYPAKLDYRGPRGLRALGLARRDPAEFELCTDRGCSSLYSINNYKRKVQCKHTKGMCCILYDNNYITCCKAHNIAKSAYPVIVVSGGVVAAASCGSLLQNCLDLLIFLRVM